MKNVIVIGGVSYDTIVHMDSFPEPRPHTLFAGSSYDAVGSTGAGKSLSLKKLGMNVSLHGLIGNDIYGEIIRKSMYKEGIDFICSLDPKGTERHVNLMDKNGGRISIYTSCSTFEPEVDFQPIEEKVRKSDYIVLNIINYCRHCIPFIKKLKKEIWCDIHDFDGRNPYHKDFIEAADYVFMSSENIGDYREFMKSLIARGKKLVICTHGRDGATALTQDGSWIEVPIVSSFEAIDTNGAGDNFFSGFMYAHSKGYSMEKCLTMASITAAMCVASRELVHEELSGERLEMEYRRMFL